MGSANLLPIGDANLGVQDKARDFRFSDAHTCHHDIRLAILVSLAPFMLLLGGALPSCFWLLENIKAELKMKLFQCFFFKKFYF